MRRAAALLIASVFICLSAAGAAAMYKNSGSDSAPAGPAPIYHADTEEKTAALMCNVYQGSEYVEKILDICRDEGVKITFYIGGLWAKDNQQLIRRMAEEGHAIGNHGTRHLLHSRLTEEENMREIEECENIIYEACGIRTYLFQPPAGDCGGATLRAAEKLGYVTTLWSADTIDWRDHDPALHLKRVKEKARSGAFILTHPTKETVSAYPDIIKYLKSEGYSLKTVEQMLFP